MKDKIRVTNIQRMCFHDGPGIRTTVFLKGCSLHCPWCSNPENISFMPEAYEKNGRKSTYGKDYSAEELLPLLLKDKIFWDREGGVTFSGGEPIIQAQVLRDLLKELKESGVHTAVETALFVPEENLEMVIPYIDYFIVDIKILDPDICGEVLGGDIALYLRNIETLSGTGKMKLFRIPCCPEYTFTEENKSSLAAFLERHASVPVQLFEIHGLGEQKYASLNRTMWKSAGVGKTELGAYRDFLGSQGIRAEVISI